MRGQVACRSCPGSIECEQIATPLRWQPEPVLEWKHKHEEVIEYCFGQWIWSSKFALRFSERNQKLDALLVILDFQNTPLMWIVSASMPLDCVH
jgi:hypothetical protein